MKGMSGKAVDFEMDLLSTFERKVSDRAFDLQEDPDGDVTEEHVKQALLEICAETIKEMSDVGPMDHQRT